MKTFKHLNHLKWREGRGFAERRSFVLRKRKEKKRKEEEENRENLRGCLVLQF